MITSHISFERRSVSIKIFLSIGLTTSILTSFAKQAYIIGWGSNNILSLSLSSNGDFDKTQIAETRVIMNPWFMTQSNHFQEDKTFYLNQENAAELSFYQWHDDNLPLQYLWGLQLSGHPWGWGFLDDYLYISSHMENKMYVYKRHNSTQFELLQALDAPSPTGFGIINHNLYTTSWLNNKALNYSIDEENGSLTLEQEIASCLKPRGIWTFNIGASDNPFYMGYTICEDSNQIGVYQIDVNNRLQFKKNISSAGINPIAMGFYSAVSAGQRHDFAYVANYYSNDLAVYKILNTSSENPGGLEYITKYKTGINPFNLAIDNETSRLYMPNMGSNDVYTYQINTNGTLLLLDKWKLPGVISPVTVNIY